MHRTPIPRTSTTRSEGLLDLVHTDVAGPLPVPSKGGALYFVTFIDDKSRWLTAFPIKSKSDCFSYFLKFRSFVEIQTGRKIKRNSIRRGVVSICRTSLKRYVAKRNTPPEDLLVHAAAKRSR